MWKRNGYSVVNQVINFQFYYSREIMYDKDIVMLQVRCTHGIVPCRLCTQYIIYMYMVCL